VAREESKPQRLDRELGELLQELRVLLPGVQVLFAFLLTVPFTSRFETATQSEKALFLAALVCAALASVLLIAPSAFHRILFRERDKEWMIFASNGFVITGTAFLAIAMTCALFLVSEVIYGSTLAAAVASGLGLTFLVVWYVVPLARRTRG
jgi:predicted neutral ceramidase superfamily lipid hydrolase